MTITKLYVTAVITAIVISIATTTAFPNEMVFATFLAPPEQVGNNTATTTDATTSPAGQQSTIHITKDGTNSYVISGG